MERLPLIPIPASQRWREFRIQGIPLLVFSAAVVTAVYLWKQQVAGPILVGEVEVISAIVTSPQPGSLAHLRVSLFERVATGDTVAQIITTEPKIIEASLAVIRAEVELLRLTLEPVADRQRNAMDYERLRLEWMAQRVELATSRVQMQHAIREFDRIGRMFLDRLVSEDQFERAKAQRDTLTVEVEEKEKLVQRLEPGLERLKPVLDLPPTDGPNNPLRAALGVQEEKLRLTEAQMSPIELKAPIHGRVSKLNRRTGENIVAGDTILTIVSERAERIIAYVPQPYAWEPRTGMSVRVRSRSLERAVREAKILEVGGWLEPIRAGMRRTPNVVDSGLAFVVSLPPDLRLRPGEFVDLVLSP